MKSWCGKISGSKMIQGFLHNYFVRQNTADFLN